MPSVEAGLVASVGDSPAVDQIQGNGRSIGCQEILQSVSAGDRSQNRARKLNLRRSPFQDISIPKLFQENVVHDPNIWPPIIVQLGIEQSVGEVITGGEQESFRRESIENKVKEGSECLVLTLVLCFIVPPDSKCRG